MRLYFSNQGNLRNFQQFIMSLDLSGTDILEISAHQKWITVHPANLVLAAALAQKVGKQNAKIIGNLPDTGRYLDRMGLYNFVSTPSPFQYTKKEEAGRFVPLRIINTATEQQNFITDLIPLLHLSESDASAVKYVVGELIGNVLEHSYAVGGALVAAQYYPKTNRVGLGICDTGIGIRQSMESYWQPKSDLEALHLAMTPGISGTSSKEGGSNQNAGAGLFFTRAIAKTARNYFVLYSGAAEFTLLKYRSDLKKPQKLFADPTDEHHSEITNAPFFQGTLVGVDISLGEVLDFQSLIQKINVAYSQAIRERKAMVYKEPRIV